ncbi:Na+/H+ antiporter NhaC family protein [Luteolibacter sp. AS25]|uniref:Na+/H+ antiporter NhaC family protein n=1 Tax=Luteolibacter sp. AS25 TaxID=3135776 RepID=UPI00398B9569
MKKASVISVLLLLSLFLPLLGPPEFLLALWPAICALVVISITRQAALGLGSGVIAGALLIHHQQPISAIRAIFADYVFPSLEGSWHIGAIIFTLLLGSFAGLLEKSGGFQPILTRLTARAKSPEKRLLGSVYLIGLLCFFDGLANSLLTGRISRPLADRTKISRERLAWVVDSTSSPVACVAFISTWIATQLSLIREGLENAPFPVEPYALYFQSIPANPYCLLTLLLVPAAILFSYQPQAMRRYLPVPPEPEDSEPTGNQTSARHVIIPLLALVCGIFAAFPLLSSPMTDPLSPAGWRTAFSGDAGPYALCAGSILGLTVAWLMFPKNRKTTPAEAAYHGAANLLPAIIILTLAWSLGNIFSELRAGEQISALLSDHFPVNWLPLAVFAAAAITSFSTGSSWGAMGLLMPLALPATLAAAQSDGLPTTEITTLIPAVIGAVFGGAVFGDHCSPFSDTTIVSAIATGCEPTAHVHSQLPFAAIAATFAAISYSLIALHLLPILATLLAAILMLATILALKKYQSSQKNT